MHSFCRNREDLTKAFSTRVAAAAVQGGGKLYDIKVHRVRAEATICLVLRQVAQRRCLPLGSRYRDLEEFQGPQVGYAGLAIKCE